LTADLDDQAPNGFQPSFYPRLNQFVGLVLVAVFDGETKTQQYTRRACSRNLRGHHGGDVFMLSTLIAQRERQ